MNDFCIAGFGEVMLRLSPPGKKRFQQTLPGILEATFGGGEANVCASIAMLGGRSRYLTALPDNPVARSFATQLRGLGCDVSRIKYTDGGRMGVYYAEHGSNMRGSNVIYDRENSVISLLKATDYDFISMLDQVTHLHLTGITPALSARAFEVTRELAAYASRSGITVSIDLNYRKKLWNWEPGTPKNELARRCMLQIVPFADIIIGNEDDAADIFGIAPENNAVESGVLNVGGYRTVAMALSELFPKAKYIATTLRQSISADHNNWGGMLFECTSGRIHLAPLDENGNYAPYELHDIVDRFGGGDSFAAGLLFALNTPELAEPATAVRFAVAASALKHTVAADYNCVSRKEVESLMTGSVSGRVQR